MKCLIEIDGGSAESRQDVAEEVAQRLPSSTLEDGQISRLRNHAASVGLDLIVHEKRIGRFEEAMLRLAHASALADYSGPGVCIPIVRPADRSSPPLEAWTAFLQELGPNSAILCGRLREERSQLVLAFEVEDVKSGRYSLAVAADQLDPGAIARLVCAVVRAAEGRGSRRLPFEWRLQPGS